MSVEWVKDTPKRTISITFPQHWVDFLHQEARHMNKVTGTSNHTPQTVIYQAVKRFAYERGFIQVGSNRSGVVVRRDSEADDDV